MPFGINFNDQDYRSGLFGKVANTGSFKARQKLFASEDERSAAIDQLNRNLGTLQSQSYNQAADVAGMNDLPAASRAALLRNISGQYAQMSREGSVDLERLFAGMDRQSAMFLLQYLQRNREFEQSQPNIFSQLLGTIGSGLGFALGGGAGAGAGGFLGRLFGGGGGQGGAQ